MTARIVVPGVEALASFVGKEFGPGAWQTLDQEQIHAFAAATGDEQWILVDPERARQETPLGRTVAHGYLTLALAPVLMKDLFEVEGCTRVINYGIDKLRFREPVPSDSRIRLSGTLLGARGVPGGGARASFDLVWEVEGARRPACRAQAVYVYFP